MRTFQNTNLTGFGMFFLWFANCMRRLKKKYYYDIISNIC